MTIHVVQPGETINSIANQYGIPASDIIQYNELGEPNRLVVGQTLVILFPRRVHVVEAGETVYSIAQQYGITVNELYRNNTKLGALNRIHPGERLVISFEQPRLGDMRVNGYAYPFVDRTLYRQTMPFMTYATPFTYGFTFDGDLIPLDDEELIFIARQYGVAPLLHLSTLTEDGGFSNELAHRALNDMQVQNRLLDNVLTTMRQKNYKGMDVDFEFIYPTDRDRYVQFVQNATTRFNAEGFEVIVALAPKTSSDQPGLLYEGHDYGGLGAAANAVLLMTYEWGYTYGPPMAVAPIPNIRAVLDYAVTQIARNKIYMGMPNYGYDWPLPFVRGTTRAQSISNIEAVRLAREYRAEILFDERAQAPHFQYTNNQGEVHEVWFEDARSIRSKLALIPEYGFLGVGYWNLMRPFPQNWLVLNALYRILAF
ncbi:glycoside hydrolase family 18 protein [Clostridium minihomine]|uniref:glycoside hydrolase family 18 protein n=1 Tax=Clostridium minihomine TaxID=2045012 RepID=UPI000C7942C0|nr:LysM peptidoglycan-binding domain-containing protein [Clostridium minihomine]